MDAFQLFVEEYEGGTPYGQFKAQSEGKGFDSNMSHGREDANDCNLDYLEVIRM